MQRPGELLFVPHLWWHATSNIDDTIAVGAQASGFQHGPQPSQQSTDRAVRGCALLVSHMAGGQQETSRRLAMYETAWRLEPLSVRHILGFAEALFDGRRELDALAMLNERATVVEELCHQALITDADAKQLVGRMGSWLDQRMAQRPPPQQPAPWAAAGGSDDVGTVHRAAARLYDRLRKLYDSGFEPSTSDRTRFVEHPAEHEQEH